MRNLKKLLAVIVAICVLATVMVPAFAETKSDAEKCTELGVILGTGDGVTDEYLATQPDRVQGAIMLLRLMGLEDEAKAYTGTSSFTDIGMLNDTNKAIVAYLEANPELGFVGIGGGKFDPLAKMEAKQYYKVLLTVLGYTYGTDATADFTWNTVFSFAASKKLVKLIDNDKFTVNDLCIGTVEALEATVKGGTDTLIAKLVLDGNIAADKAIASGLYAPASVALEVKSATADNLILAKIVFNKELNADTVNTTNISASNLDSVTLGEDKKTVYAKLKSAVTAQDTVVDFTFENVKDTSGATITKVTKSINFKDVTTPVVSGVVIKNAKTLVISASEPLNYVKGTYQPLNSIKIDGAVAFGTTAVDYVKNTITVKLYTALTTGTKKIDITDLTDYAGYKAVATSFNAEVIADTAAPVLTSATFKNLNTIEVLFDEDLEVPGDFYVNGSSTKASAVRDTANNAKVTLTLPSGVELGIGSIVEIKIEYVGQKDVMGNEVKTKTAYTFKVDDDTALPTVTAAIAEGNKITLTFSKPMYGAGTIKILKASDSTKVGNTKTVTDATFKDGSNKTIIELDAVTMGLSNQDPLAVKVNITGMRDATIRQNVLAEQNLALTLLDTKLPEVGMKYKATADASDHTKDYVTFYFNEAMNVDTIKALSSYSITSGSAYTGLLSSFTDISLKEVASDAKSVSFYVPGIASAGKYAGAVFAVYAVKDAAGNMQPQTLGITVNTTTAFGPVGSPVATGRRVIKVTFSDKIGSIDYTAFEVKNSAGDVVAYGGSGSLSTPTQAAIDLYSDLPYSTTGLSVAFNSNRGNIKDIYGNEVTATTAGILIDQIKPGVAIEAGSTPGSITLTFDELMSGLANGGSTTVGASGISGKIRIVKDGAQVVTTAAAVNFFNGTTAVVAGAPFDKIVITGLEHGATYVVTVFDGIFKDDNGSNYVDYVAGVSVTTNEP